MDVSGGQLLVEVTLPQRVQVKGSRAFYHVITVGKIFFKKNLIIKNTYRRNRPWR